MLNRWLRSLSAVAVGVALGACSCGGGATATHAGERQRFIPATYGEGDRVVLPLIFPDGTAAELVYSANLDVASLGAFPYDSGTLQGSPVPGRGDLIGRDFVIRYGDLDGLLEVWNEHRPPRLVAQYEGAEGAVVGLWDFDWNDTAHYLGFQFGAWAVLVYDYVGAGAMTDAERASWAASFSGSETDEGFLVLEGSGPLQLAKAGEHAGPHLTFAAGNPTRHLIVFPGTCTPHRDQTTVIAGKLVQWSGGFADWCLSDAMRIHASGPEEFVGSLIRGLEARDVVLGTS